MTKVFASGASQDAVLCASTPPKVSRLAQRFSEATTSALVTGLPSWNSRPSRSLKVQVSESFETPQVSTICGLILPSASVPNSVS
jgi:hypothetical protein